MPEQRLRVLLVDDEPSIIKVVGKQLQLAGFEVAVAVNGDEALAAARAQLPDAIVLDLMLPQRSGIDVCMNLRKDARLHRTPIIFYTGKEKDDVISTMGRDVALLRDAGADAFVEKLDGSLALVKQIRLHVAKRAAATPPTATAS